MRQNHQHSAKLTVFQKQKQYWQNKGILTIGIVEDNSCKVIQAECLVDGSFGLQVVSVGSMLTVEFVQHGPVCALITEVQHEGFT